MGLGFCHFHWPPPPPSGSEFERYLQRYLFPCLIVFGILGNALNLTVLLNPKMHSRANTFLAMLAFADIVFLSLVSAHTSRNVGPTLLRVFITFADLISILVIFGPRFL